MASLTSLRETYFAMLREMTVAVSNRRWDEALKYACDISNMGVTSSREGGTLPYKK